MSKKKLLVMILALGTILAFGAAALAADTFYVGPSGTATVIDIAGSKTVPYATLYDCIEYEDSLTGDDTIYVDNGTYAPDGDIVIPTTLNGLTIIGKQWETTDLVPGTDSAVIHFTGTANGTMITIKADNVTIMVDDSSSTSDCEYFDLVSDLGSGFYDYGIKLYTGDVGASVASVEVKDVHMADTSYGIDVAGIYFKQGTSHLDTYTVTGTIDNCEISCTGATGVGILLENNTALAMDVDIRNCTLDGDTSPDQDVGIKLTGISSTDTLFTGTVIEKNIITDHDHDSGAIGIHLDEASNATVKYNSIGLDATESAATNVTGLQVDDDDTGADADGLTIQYNYFGSDTKDVIWTGAGTGNVLDHNHFTGGGTWFTNSDTDVILDARYNYWGTDTAPTVATTDTTPCLKKADLTNTYVDATWDSQVEMATGRLFGYDAFSTIQAGVAAIPAGTSQHYINVAAGTYDSGSFPIVIDENNLTLRSTDGAATTTIDPAAAVAIQVRAANVTIGGSGCGFTIKSSANNGVMLQSIQGCTNPTVQGNIIRSQHYGIYADGGAGNAIKATIKDNTIAPTTPPATYCGIWLTPLGGTVIDNNDVSNYAVGMSLWGDALQDATWANPITISNNRIDSSTYEGLGLDGRVAAGGADAALDHVVVSGNDCYGNTTNGMQFTGGGLDAVRVVDNNLYNNTESGLWLKSLIGANVANIDVAGGNSIYGNTDYGIKNSNATDVPATGNWWGHASGPYHPTKNPDGLGNEVTNYVDFIPFWTTPTGGSTTADTWGVFRAGDWYLDITGDGDAGDTYETVNFGGLSDGVPLVGDWSGTGTDTWGVWRAGTWYLDKNGDGDADDPGETFNFGNATDVPLVGNWDGIGPDTWGVFRDGAWFLDHDGDGTADEAFCFGNATDTPLVGDWGGTPGTDTCGVFRDGAWFLDKNGDYDATDVGEVFYFGNATDTPLVGDWGGTPGTDTCGVWRAGAWFLDKNGDNDAADTGEAFNFGLSTDTPLVGNWGSGSAAPQAPQAASAAGWYAMCFPNPASTGDAVTFRMMGAGVNAVQVSIYDLGGGLVYQSNFETGRSLTWDLYSEGAPVANGIYLYAVTAKAYGELISTEVGKLLILR